MFTAYTCPDATSSAIPAGRLRRHHARLTLSNGVSQSTTINGGTGDDIFAVFRNVATLQLNGDAGDDTFIIRTFLLESETDPAQLRRRPRPRAVRPQRAGRHRRRRRLRHRRGRRHRDRRRVRDHVGRHLRRRPLRLLPERRAADIDGQEGNDTFYVQSTNPPSRPASSAGSAATGSRSPVTRPAVQANDFLGHSGLTRSSVESDPEQLDRHPGRRRSPRRSSTTTPRPGVLAGCRLGPVHRARERHRRRSWTVRLAKAPTADVEVTFTAPAVDPTNPRRDRAIELRLGGSGAWGTTVTLTFTAADWATAQSVQLRAFVGDVADDLASEGERSYVVQTRVVSTDGTNPAISSYQTLKVANTIVRVLDDDQVGLTQEVVAGGLVTVEGTEPRRAAPRRTSSASTVHRGPATTSPSRSRPTDRCTSAATPAPRPRRPWSSRRVGRWRGPCGCGPRPTASSRVATSPTSPRR